MKNLLVFSALVGLAVFSRMIDHAPNLTAVAAVAMFAGWYFRGRALALAAPISAMLISDVLIGGYQPLVMLAVYSALAAPVLLGRFFGRERSPAGLLGRAMLGSFASATLFFVVTNLAVWLASGYYPRSAEGLLACYAAALPFFRYTLAGDLGYAMLLFGGHLALVRFVRPALACRAAAPTA